MSMQNRRVRALLQAILATGVIAILPVGAWANLPIYKIADFNTPAPDGGTFTSFSAPTADRQTNFYTGQEPFWFQATTSTGASGVYVYDATHQEYFTLADTTMTVPQGGATFTGFSNLSSGYGEVGFIATDSSGNQGVYAIGDFPLTLVASSDTSPSAGVTFGNFQSISIMGQYAYGRLGGEIESDAGIYDFQLGEYIGDPTAFILVADTNTTPLGASGPFTSFGPVSFKNIQASGDQPGVLYATQAVRATVNGVVGIYANIEQYYSPYAEIVAAGAATPDGIGHFTSFGNPIATTNEIAFTAHYSTANGDQQGVFIYGPYEDDNGPLVQLDELVATGDVAPDSGGATFTGFSDLTDDSYYKIFIASLSNGQEGLFVSTNLTEYEYDYYDPALTQITEVVETGSILDGKTVAGIDLASEASEYPISGPPGGFVSVGPAAFLVDFTDGSQGLYYFTAPEPASLCLAALPLILLSRRRRHPKKSATVQNGSMVEPLEQRRLFSSVRAIASSGSSCGGDF